MGMRARATALKSHAEVPPKLCSRAEQEFNAIQCHLTVSHACAPMVGPMPCFHQQKNKELFHLVRAWGGWFLRPNWVVSKACRFGLLGCEKITRVFGGWFDGDGTWVSRLICKGLYLRFLAPLPHLFPVAELLGNVSSSSSSQALNLVVFGFCYWSDLNEWCSELAELCKIAACVVWDLFFKSHCWGLAFRQR